MQTKTYAKTNEYKEFYPCAVMCNRELHAASSDRSVRHISLQLPEGVSYQTGDHLAVEAANLPEEVEKLAGALKLSLDTRFTLQSVQAAVDPPAWARSPLSVRTAFTYFCEIMSPLSSEGLELLAASARDPGVKPVDSYLSSRPPAGSDYVAGHGRNEADAFVVFAGEQAEIVRLTSDLDAYQAVVADQRLSVSDILLRFPSADLELGALLSVLPPLRPRLYSISSSAVLAPTDVSVTVGVVQYQLSDGRERRGVVSWTLQSEKSSVRCQIIKSHFRLPSDPSVPIVCIGAGTGLAPFLGFLGDRVASREQGVATAQMLLFFGCRSSQHDFIYREYLEAQQALGNLTLHVAFSREPNMPKAYVQHKLEEHAQSVCEALIDHGGSIYVCGDARTMARDVNSAVCRILSARFGNDKTADEFLCMCAAQGRYQRDVWAG